MSELHATIEVENPNEDADEEYVEVKLPGKHTVCSDCEGHGSVLNASMRNHAYTQEEIDQDFSEDMKKQYFKRGGIYDVTCPTCHGLRVVVTVDDARLTSEQRKQWKQHLTRERVRQEEEAADRFTARMERGGYD